MTSPPVDAGSGSGWTLHVESLREGTRELAVLRGGTTVSYGEVVGLWRGDPAFRAFFDEALGRATAASRCGAVFWETPPVTSDTFQQPFRCVLVEAPGLTRMAPEPFVFEAELERAGPSGIGCFPNLGGDALLVVPAARPGVPADSYPHLAAFLAGAPIDQRQALWAAVGEAVNARLGPQPLWVSTSGAGVAWLHVRLDSVPKYYVHAPYRSASS